MEGAEDTAAEEVSDYKLQLEAVKDHMRAVRMADEEAAAHVAKETDELQDESAEAQEEYERMEPEVAQQEREKHEVMGRLREVEYEILTLKDQLDAAHGQRRGLDLESQRLLGARNHFSAQRRFLEGIAKLEQQLLDAIVDVGDRIKKSNDDIEVDTNVLKQQQAALQLQVAREKELVQQEVRKHSEADNKLRRMRREMQASEVELKEFEMRERYLRQMQQEKGTNTWSPVVAGAGSVPGGNPFKAPPRGLFPGSPTGGVSLGSRPDV